jgi:16S rRNA (cytosine967-C5)-methyltransferase
MPISPARRTAFSILLRVEREQAYASDLLHSELDALTPADRGLCTEIVMGTLRWQSKLDSELSTVSSQRLPKLDREVLIALRMAVYQLRHLERVPAHAALNDSVELVKRARKGSAAPFVNAVLRKLTKAPAMEFSGSGDPDDLAVDYAHPQWLVERWLAHYGEAATHAMLADNQKAPETTLRLSDADAVAELEGEDIALAPGKLVSTARRVLSGDPTRTQAFKQGRVAIQDEASQLVALMVGHGERILDCCAAPGSKTLLLAERNPRAQIVASELHPHRAQLLSQRLADHPSVKVVAEDASSPSSDALFDCILADVPCSGTGTLARNPEIKWKLQLSDLSDLQRRQTAILMAALKRLKPGGRLVYSTCSLEPEENEAAIDLVLAAQPEFRVVPAAEVLRALPELAWPNVDTLIYGPYLRTIPGVHPCEGFFAAVLTR